MAIKGEKKNPLYSIFNVKILSEAGETLRTTVQSKQHTFNT